MTPGIPGQVLSGSRFSIFQQLRDQVYLKCLQSHAQQAAPRAAAKAGTFITKAGTFTTFDPRLPFNSTHRYQPGGGDHGSLYRRERHGGTRLSARPRRHHHHVRSSGLPTDHRRRLSTRRGRSREPISTRASPLTASCGPPTAPSPRSIPRAPYSPQPAVSTRRGRSREATSTRAAWHTASCAPATAPSPRLIPRAP